MPQREKIKNIPASIKARLRLVAQKEDIDFNRAFLLYMQEGFLRRVSLSPYKDRFVLKGGILFYGQFEKRARPTKDIDFLATDVSNTPANLEAILRVISEQPASDGIRFDADHIDIKEIKEHAEYRSLAINRKARPLAT